MNQRASSLTIGAASKSRLRLWHKKMQLRLRQYDHLNCKNSNLVTLVTLQCGGGLHMPSLQRAFRWFDPVVPTAPCSPLWRDHPANAVHLHLLLLLHLLLRLSPLTAGGTCDAAPGVTRSVKWKKFYHRKIFLQFIVTHTVFTWIRGYYLYLPVITGNWWFLLFIYRQHIFSSSSFVCP